MADPYFSQDRSIDPYASYYSSVVNQIHRLVSRGVDCLHSTHAMDVIADSTSPLDVVVVTTGGLFKDDVYIENLSNFQVDLTDLDFYAPGTLTPWDSTGYYYITVSYNYTRSRPPPRASIRVLKPSQRSLLTTHSQFFLLKVLSIVDGTAGLEIEAFYDYDPEYPNNKRVFSQTYIGLEYTLPTFVRSRDEGRIVLAVDMNQVYWGKTNGWDPIFTTDCVSRMSRIRTITDGDTTPSILAVSGAAFLRCGWLITNNSATTTITDFDAVGGDSTAVDDGVEITVYFTDNNTTVQNNANIQLNGGVDFVGSVNDALTLIYDSSNWVEKTRRVEATGSVNVETLTGNKILTVHDKRAQFLNPNGSNRNVYLPSELLSDGLKFWITNTYYVEDSTSDISLFVYGSDGTSLISIIGENESAWHACDGSTWVAGKIGSGPTDKITTTISSWTASGIYYYADIDITNLTGKMNVSSTFYDDSDEVVSPYRIETVDSNTLRVWMPVNTVDLRVVIYG